ncbi:type VI secretion system amidase effector protein Tae4 [Acinetobacter tibetensis]|uniref:Type VI secretion system amidase effector protein Tae4 n=2 Tax=Acinetobacter TaxID=469 RepID=A0AAE9S0R7_9GAMM|nr:type VI secretion system amidase effector protein Tae4 [Acinetobacter tibetensis]USE84081.1 type VI secretion system amidase effector protein Tae4 [Acinetobacter tibetensis]
MGTGIRATSSGQASTIQVNRPLFYELWKNYPIKMAAPDVYQTVGGQAFALYQENPTGYANACALRLSKALNYGGMPIKQTTKGYKVKGKDNKPYLLRVKEMISFVENNLGKADITLRPKNNEDVSSQLSNKKGIIIFKVSGWGDATGHVTLWNGNDCGDSCYFVHHQQGVTTTEVLFWNLK